MDSAARPDQEIVFPAEWAEDRPDLRVEVRVVPSVQGDDGGRRTTVGEHADENEIDVMDPVKSGVAANIEAFTGKHLDASL